MQVCSHNRSSPMHYSGRNNKETAWQYCGIHHSSTYSLHRWARLLKQQMSITVYRLPTRKTKLRFPLAENKQKLVVSIFCLQQTNGNFHFMLVPYIPIRYFFLYLYMLLLQYMYIYTENKTNRKRKLPFIATNGKWTPRRISLIRWPFAHHAWHPPLFIHLFLIWDA